MGNPFATFPSRNRIACDALFVDGAARGAILGGIWGLAFHGLSGPIQSTRVLAVVKNSLAFAVFLGAYGGVACLVDKQTDSRATVFSSFMGGFTAGVTVSVVEKTSRRGWLVNGAVAGMLTSLFTYATMDEHFGLK